MSGIEAERNIRDMGKTITAYQTQINAMMNAVGDGESTPEKPRNVLHSLMEGFNTMMAAIKEERETHYGDRTRDYAAGRIVSEKSIKVEIKEPDYAAIINDMEQGLTAENIPQTDPAWNVVAALKTKYNVQ